MPEESYLWLEREELLRFEELLEVVQALLPLGLKKVRLTGGEPLLRRGLSTLVEQLSQLPIELALTTNGLLLSQQLEALVQAGLRRFTVSLDTLRPDVFHQLARRQGLELVLGALRELARREVEPIKLDTVVLRGVNDDQLPELVDFAGELGAEIRFIEYMDVGGATRWSAQQVVSQAEILARLGGAEPLDGRGSAPAQRFRLSSGQVIGIIASVTQPFCADCDRLRLTADGQLLTCLYAKEGLDLRAFLRSSPPGQMGTALRQLWENRRDQGAVERSRTSSRGGYVSLEELRANPRLEMHTRGG
jgi:cyclic pyranopterin phosphate synthase